MQTDDLLQAPPADASEESHLLQFLGLSVGQAMLLFAGTVGLASGAAAAFFYQLINVSVRVFLLAQPTTTSFWRVAGVVLTPAVGGLVCGVLLHYFAPDARGGVSEVIDALLHRGGYIRSRVGFFKALASAICIGSGGSAGREGPVVQIGGSVGSTLARLFRVSPRRSQLLVACGAAGGIAAVFNAPIAGAFFAAEIITGRFEMRDLSLLFTSSAMGAVVARGLLGDLAGFQTPPYRLVTGWALILHVLLGVLCALVGHLFIFALHRSEEFFGGLKAHPVVKPALGGLMVGVIGLWVPQVFGTGGEIMSELFRRPVLPSLLLLWLFSKLVATALTLGSGGSGGDLMPSLFLGAATGGALGHLAHGAFPAVTMPAGGYALIGASALFSAVSHAPMTAIILGFEMGRDYGLVLPLLIACSISSLISAHIRTASLYTFKLQQRGIDLRTLRGTRVDLLDTVRVGDVMSREVPSVPPDMTVSELLERFTETGRHGFVVAEGGRLRGIVTLSDTRTALQSPGGEKWVRDIATPDPIVCHPDDTLTGALRRLGAREVGRIPVVSREDPEALVGLLRRSDILRGYSLAVNPEKR
jgi:CIC family chloride channel protein